MEKKVRFKVSRITTPILGTRDAGMVGLIRGLEKAREVTFVGSIEFDTTKEHYIITVMMAKSHFLLAKGQAESYGVIVEEVQ